MGDRLLLNRGNASLFHTDSITPDYKTKEPKFLIVELALCDIYN